MIREFFSPRFTMIFVALLALAWFGLFVWMKGTPEEHRKWLTHARIPFIAGAVSLTLTVALAIVVQIFD